MVNDIYSAGAKSAQEMEKLLDQSTGYSHDLSDQVTKNELQTAEREARTAAITAARLAQKELKKESQIAKKSINVTHNSVGDGAKVAKKAVSGTVNAATTSSSVINHGVGIATGTATLGAGEVVMATVDAGKNAAIKGVTKATTCTADVIADSWGNLDKSWNSTIEEVF